MRSNSFIKRVQMAFRYVFRDKDEARIMTCGNCGSTHIAPVPDTASDIELPPEFRDKGIKRIWEEADICQACGAQTVERQYWLW